MRFLLLGELDFPQFSDDSLMNWTLLFEVIQNELLISPVSKWLQWGLDNFVPGPRPPYYCKLFSQFLFLFTLGGARQPNIVIILADDLGYNDIG